MSRSNFDTAAVAEYKTLYTVLCDDDTVDAGPIASRLDWLYLHMDPDEVYEVARWCGAISEREAADLARGLSGG